MLRSFPAAPVVFVPAADEDCACAGDGVAAGTAVAGVSEMARALSTLSRLGPFERRRKRTMPAATREVAMSATPPRAMAMMPPSDSALVAAPCGASICSEVDAPALTWEHVPSVRVHVWAGSDERDGVDAGDHHCRARADCDGQRERDGDGSADMERETATERAARKTARRP